MSESYEVIDSSGHRTFTLQFEGGPDYCPFCHKSSLPIFLSAHIDVNLSNNISQMPDCEVLFRCPNNDCRRVFVAIYYYRNTSGFIYSNVFYPILPENIDFSNEINQISKDFTVIFNQAKAAEESNLLLIAGPGYRKALEFLIKDYAIKNSPEGSHDDIKKNPLGDVISNYIDDGKIKDISVRAAWLGNDETHYLRKWETKDLSDLKDFIRMIVNWIENDEKYKKVMEDMPSGKK
jgi:hypothetical protein